jgi:hypothetical protein
MSMTSVSGQIGSFHVSSAFEKDGDPAALTLTAARHVDQRFYQTPVTEHFLENCYTVLQRQSSDAKTAFRVQVVLESITQSGGAR